MPHFDSPERVQFITFRLFDSVPAGVIDRWKKELAIIPDLDKNHPCATELYRRLAAYEDTGRGACFLRQPPVTETVQKALLFFDGQRYRLLEWSIMPNHVHVLLATMTGHPVPQILHSWKSFTAKECNKILARRGTFWMEDYFDRFIRTEQHFAYARNYIRNNPVKAGLCQAPEQWRWSSAYGTRTSRPLADRMSALHVTAS
ncbi:MAG: transposase [Verrucomicrobiales bacterium]|nr:transposase [Verrucomicrobiales bacterium]